MTDKIDSIYRTRSLGVAAIGIPDQYADGKAAKVWSKYVGDQNRRTGFYRKKLLEVLHEYKVKTVFDVACGTGVDSILMVEEGFRVTSVDASDKMLKYALKVRWARRKEPDFDNWVIEEGNWLHLKDADIDIPNGGFDCLICLGNSFAHLPDFDGENKAQIQAIENFRDCLRPGGILMIDHRNYDHIVSGGKPPMKNIYYDSQAPVDVKTSVLLVDNKYSLVTLDYVIKEEEPSSNGEADSDSPPFKKKKDESSNKFRLSYYPHLLQNFNKLLELVFGKDAKHTILGDFQPLESTDNPAYYVHIIQKP
ncbi:glycine N-methyltransferase-like [Rhopilema esculentum]|uniref:glycine N-methyltransferase-like n=1 Tax=Rhopilema esculentum TaxID=499914 RepID=UPI0031DB3130|eukprot:gene3001-1261_t